VRTVYVKYKDRLTRFCYGYLETIFRCHGTDIKIMKDETENKDGQKELVEDMMSLIASFSGRLYGMRSRQRRKQIDEQNQKS
jgi:putative resolvase